MSTSSPKLPLSAVIFDRSQKGLSDVPVFSDALKKKVNTPSQEISNLALSPVAQHILSHIQTESPRLRQLADSEGQARIKNSHVAPALRDRQELRESRENPNSKIQIPNLDTSEFQDSVLRADSDRGQTSGFAQSTEGGKGVRDQGSEASGNNYSSLLYEDPTLVRSHLEAGAILSQLRALTKDFPQVKSSIIGAPQYQRIQISSVSPLLADYHTAGLLDVVVIPRVLTSNWDPIEEYMVTFRRELWKLKLFLQTQVSSLPDKKVVLQTQIETLLSLCTQVFEIVRAVPRAIGRSLIFTSSVVVGKGSMFLARMREQSQAKVQATSNKGQEAMEGKWKQVEHTKLSFDFHRLLDLKDKLFLKLEELRQVLVSSNRPSFTKLASRIMIAGSLVLMLLTVGPMVALEAHSIKQKIVYSIQNLSTKASDVAGGKAIEVMIPTPTPTPNPDPEKQFQILIPKIGVDSKVIANVDPGKEKDYTEALKKGVAHAAGTGLPGEANTNNKTIFIFGHSTNGAWNVTRYNALFYSLKDMVVGDTFTMWFWGKEFTYKVTETKVVAANDVSFLTPQTDKDQLILQTCWPPGTSWKRFLVIAEPIKTN